jgi:hypothetical protein
MKPRVIKVNKLAGWLIAGIFTSGVAIPAFAQGRPPGPPAGAGPPPNINPKREDLLRETSHSRMRTAELAADAEVENEKHIQAAIANMKQDFARIQVLRNDIARNLVAHKPLDYNLITEQTAEINKRAHRLNVYMLAHGPADKEQAIPPDPKSEEMVSSLVKLCQLIDSFTENPALKDASTVDAKAIQKARQNKAKADADLLSIMKLSENIHKKSDSLRPPK